MAQGSQGGAVEGAPHLLISVPRQNTLTHLQLTLICFLFIISVQFLFFCMIVKSNKIIIINKNK